MIVYYDCNIKTKEEVINGTYYILLNIRDSPEYKKNPKALAFSQSLVYSFHVICIYLRIFAFFVNIVQLHL